MKKEKILLPISFTYNLERAHNMWVYSEDEKKLKSFLLGLFNNAKVETDNCLYEVIGLLKDDKGDRRIIKEYVDCILENNYEEGREKIRVLIIYTNYFSHYLLNLIQIGYAFGFYIILGTTRLINSSFKAGCAAQINLDY